jgi:hypothetical protein
MGAAVNAWQRRAPELGEFSELHLVNTRIVWGSYLPIDRRFVDENGIEHKIFTAPKKDRRGVRLLDRYVLERHYRGLSEGHVIGLHSISPDLTSRWFAFDLDNHEGAAEKAAQNLEHAAALCAALALFGLFPRVEDSDGKGGLHIWVIFSEAVATPIVHALAVAVLATLGISAETYPKQASLTGKQLGNWLRLPGRHHTRDHWSRFLADGVWHEGEDAVELGLCTWTSPIDQLPVPPPREAAPTLPRMIRPSTADLDHRIARYMAKLPTRLHAGEGRNDAGYLFACFLVRDLALPDSVALGWLAEWNRGHATPMSETKLTSLVSEAHAYGTHSYGSAA